MRRGALADAFRRLVLLLVGVLALLCVVAQAAAAATVAGGPDVSGFNHYPTAARILLILSFLIPLASAWLTAHPSSVTGWITAGLAALGGILSDLAAHGWDTVTWQAFYTAVTAWAMAGGVHLLITKPKNADRPVEELRGPEATLHRIGPQLGAAA